MFLRVIVKHDLTWLCSEYIPEGPCQQAGVWTQQLGCHPFQRPAEPGGQRDHNSE